MFISLEKNIKFENKIVGKDGKKYKFLYSVDRRISWYSYFGKGIE